MNVFLRERRGHCLYIGRAKFYVSDTCENIKLHEVLPPIDIKNKTINPRSSSYNVKNFYIGLVEHTGNTSELCRAIIVDSEEDLRRYFSGRIEV